MTNSTTTCNSSNTVTVTDEDIKALMEEAMAHGDSEQALLCEAALAGDASARAECVEVIMECRAQ